MREARIKVAMVGPYPGPGDAISGGVERVIDTLLRELGKTVDLTLLVPGAAADGEARNHGVRTLYIKRAPGPGALRYWNIDAWRTARAVAALRPDVVHVQGAAGAASFLSAPSLVTVHGIADRDVLASGGRSGWRQLAAQGAAWLVRAVEARARAGLGNVIVINPYVVEALPDVGRLRQYAVPNPIDAAFCAAPLPGRGSRPRRLVSVGAIGPRKNTLELLRVAARVMARDREVRLSLCGVPADRAYYQACVDSIKSEGIADRVELPGNLASAELIARLDAASCLVMTSRQETAPMAIAEANARGVAAVAPEAFGIKHMIEPGRNGMFLPPGDLDLQASALSKALDHPWDRIAMAARAQEQYAPDRIAELTISAYRDVMAQRRGTASGRLPVARASEQTP